MQENSEVPIPKITQIIISHICDIFDYETSIYTIDYENSQIDKVVKNEIDEKEVDKLNQSFDIIKKYINKLSNKEFVYFLSKLHFDKLIRYIRQYDFSKQKEILNMIRKYEKKFTFTTNSAQLSYYLFG